MTPGFFIGRSSKTASMAAPDVARMLPVNPRVRRRRRCGFQHFELLQSRSEPPASLGSPAPRQTFGKSSPGPMNNWGRPPARHLAQPGPAPKKPPSVTPGTSRGQSSSEEGVPEGAKDRQGSMRDLGSLGGVFPAGTAPRRSGCVWRGEFSNRMAGSSHLNRRGPSEGGVLCGVAESDVISSGGGGGGGSCSRGPESGQLTPA